MCCLHILCLKKYHFAVLTVSDNHFPFSGYLHTDSGFVIPLLIGFAYDLPDWMLLILLDIK